MAPKKIQEKDIEQASWWRYFVNFWTLLLYAIILADFVQNNALRELIGPATVIYTGALAVYSAEKEFERWHDLYTAKHPGEIYVVLWTVLIVGLFLAETISGKPYHIPAEVSSTYVVVLSILAITKKSKSLYREKHPRRK
jgi:hypothetical protein